MTLTWVTIKSDFTSSYSYIQSILDDLKSFNVLIKDVYTEILYNSYIKITIDLELPSTPSRNVEEYYAYVEQLLSTSYQPLTFSYRYDSFPSILSFDYTRDQIVDGLKTIIQSILLNELGIKCDQWETVFFSDMCTIGCQKFINSNTKKVVVPIYVLSSQLAYLNSLCVNPELYGYELVLEDLLFYYILKLIEEDDQAFLHSNDYKIYHQKYLLLKINKIALPYIVYPKEKILQLYNQLKQDYYFSYTLITKYDKYLITEIAQEFDIQITLDLSNSTHPIKELLINHTYPRISDIPLLILHSDGGWNGKWLHNAMLDIKRGWIPSCTTSISTSTSSTSIEKWVYACTRAYFDVVMTKNPFLIYYSDTLNYILGGEQVIINGRFFSQSEILAYKQFLSNYTEKDNMKTWNVSYVSSLLDGVILRDKIKQKYSSDLIQPLLLTYHSKLFVVTNNDLYDFVVPEITDDDRVNMREKLAQHYGKVCRDQKDLVVLEEISEMDASDLLHLIPTGKGRGRGKEEEYYCYKHETIKSLVDPLIDPYTNRPFPDEVLFMIDKIDLFIMGIYPIAGIKGLFSSIDLPYIEVSQGKIEEEVEGKNNELLTFVVDYTYPVINQMEEEVSRKQVYANTVELATMRNITENKNSDKKLFQQLWNNGFFLNSWATSYYYFHNQLSVYFNKTIPYATAARTSETATRKLIDYLKNKLD